MKKNLGLQLNQGLSNVSEELNKKNIKMFYSLSDNYSSATEFFLDVKVSSQGYSKSITSVVNSLDEATTVVKKLVNELREYKERMKIQDVTNEQLRLAEDKFSMVRQIVSVFAKKFEICIQYDLMGMLELKKVNRKTITCEDSTGQKVYLDENGFNKLYSDDLIRLYARD